MNCHTYDVHLLQITQTDKFLIFINLEKYLKALVFATSNWVYSIRLAIAITGATKIETGNHFAQLDITYMLVLRFHSFAFISDILIS